MKNIYLKWLSKLALFALLFVCLDVSFGVLMKTLDRRAALLCPESDKTRYLLHDVKADVLVVGASEVEFSYRPDILMDSLGMSVYNCGKNGQRLYYQATVVNSILDRFTPKLLIWSVSPNSLTPLEDDKDKTSVFKPYYHQDPYCRQLLQKRSWYEKYKMISYFYTYNSVFHSSIINSIKPIKTNTVYGYKPIAKSVSRPEYKETHWKDSPDEQSIFLFENTVCRLKEKGIPTFFVFSPNYSYGDYHNLNSYKLLKNIIVSNGYLLTEDYYHHPSLMHNYYFKDKDHLTEEGVEMFSELLAHELKTIN